MILGQKLTLNHASLVDEEEKTRVFVTAHKKRRKRKRESCSLIKNVDVKQYISLKILHEYSCN